MEKLFERRIKMRKLLVLVFVAVFVAMMCVPSYGNNTLVYKTTQKTSDFSSGAIVAQTLNGYLVLVVTDTQDVCDAQQLTYQGVKAADKTQTTVNVTFDFTSETGYLVAHYVSGNNEAVLAGKTADGGAVGLTGKTVAKTLNGSILVGELGFGAMTATLDPKWTKSEAGKDVPDAVNDISESLTKYTVIADTTPPTPNPMTWASVPAALSDTQITMTATTATDAASPPVQYSFVNSTNTSHNSGWITSATWTDSGLTPDTNYTYTVTAEDSAAVPNLTDPSASATARTNKTATTTSPTPNPMTWASVPAAISSTQITMTATTATEPNAPPVQYYFTNMQDPNNHNSGWILTPTYVDSNLTPSKRYDYNVMARDDALVPNVTAASVEANATTLVDTTPPAGLVFSIPPYATSPTSITMQAHATDPCGVMYRFRYSTGGLVVCRGWLADGNFTDGNCTQNNTYSYQVQAEDACSNTTAWSAALGATTPLTIQTQINIAVATRGGSPYAPTTVTIPAGTYNEDPCLPEPNITLNSASGSASTIIQLVPPEANGISILSPGCTIGGSAGQGFAIKGSTTTGTVALIGANQNNTVVSYCDLNNVGIARMGVRIDAANGVTIANNTFENDANGVYLGPGFANGTTVATVRNISITNNTFTKVVTADVNFVKFAQSDACSVTISGNTADHGMSVVVGPNETNLINVTISNNTFSRGGILVSEIAPALGTDGNDNYRLQSMTISGNTFSAGSQDAALAIDAIGRTTDVNWPGLLFRGNTILRTPGGAIATVYNNIGSTTLNAQHNYWGDATGPIGVGSVLCGTTGASVLVADANANPFWTNAAMTIDANCPAP